MSDSPNMRFFRLGIDGDALRTPISGVGQYVFHVARELEALFPRAALFAYSRLAPSQLRLPSDRWVVRQEPVHQLRRLPSFLWLKTRGRSMAIADDLDVFWAGRTIHPNLPKSIRTCVTVHDLNHRIVPETMQAATRVSHALWFERDLRSASRVFANSLGTAARLKDLLGVEAEAVCRPGLDARFCQPSEAERESARAQLAELGVKPPYFLCVATLEPRKNVDKVLAAFLNLQARGELPGYQLVIAGARGWRSTALYRRIEAARDRGVVLTGYLPDELMPGLYAEATALLFPSSYEGFGMPVLEARACGTPAIISTIPELVEAAETSEHTIRPTAEELEASMLKMRDAGPRRVTPVAAEAYGWRQTASGMARCIETLLGRSAQPTSTVALT